MKPEISYYISYNRHTLDVMTIPEKREKVISQKAFLEPLMYHKAPN
jgi:hypothetical protein